jgi:hypothetical protein
MASHICWEIHRRRGGTWYCTEDNPTGFAGQDQRALLAARKISPENTLIKVKLSAGTMAADQRTKLYVFEFRWWQGDLLNKPAPFTRKVRRDGRS